jgi:CO/xanthine dehydrogenase Mo-binding subunit
VAHATIETHSATARIEAGKVTVWASTQAPFTVQQEVAQALGIPRATYV